MTRDEVTVRAGTGMLQKIIAARYVTGNRVEATVLDLNEILETLRNAVVKSPIESATRYDVPTDCLLQRFTRLGENMVVIGKRRFTIAYG